MQSSAEHAKEDLENSNQKVNELNSRLNEKEEEVESLQAELDQARQDCSSKDSSLEKKERDVKSLQGKLDQARQDCYSKDSKLQEMENAKSLAEHAKGDFKKSNQKVNELTSRLKEKEKEVESLQAERDQVQQELNSKESKLREMKNDARTRLMEKDLEIGKMKGQSLLLEQNSTRLEEQLNSIDAKYQESQGNLHEAKMEMQSFKLSNARLTKQLAHAKEEVCKLNRTVGEKENEIAQIENDKLQLQTQDLGQKSAYKYLQSNHLMLGEEIKKIQTELNAANERLKIIDAQDDVQSVATMSSANSSATSSKMKNKFEQERKKVVQLTELKTSDLDHY